MMYLGIGLLVLLLAFAGVLLRGAPYLPTLDVQAKIALELLNLKPGQTLLELGSGDGKVLLLAARQGLHAVGVELNPFLVMVSRLRTWRYRKQVRIIWGDMWRVQWPECDGVFTFLLGRFMPKLNAQMQRQAQMRSKSAAPLPLASIAFQIPGRTPDAQKNGVFLYKF